MVLPFVQNLFQWFCTNGMKLNTNKTQMIVLGTPSMLRTLPNITINFCGAVIQDSRVVKNLGVMMDRHLSFERHVDSVCEKCTGILIALCHAQHSIPRCVMKSIVQALVMSVVRYCLSVYGSCNITQTRRIQKIINFSARVVSGRRRFDHVSDVLRQLRWMRAEQLVEYHTVCAVHSAIVYGVPQHLANTIGTVASAAHGHFTRQSQNLMLPRIRSEAGRRRIAYRGVQMYNNLAVDDRVPFM